MGKCSIKINTTSSTDWENQGKRPLTAQLISNDWHQKCYYKRLLKTKVMMIAAINKIKHPCENQFVYSYNVLCTVPNNLDTTVPNYLSVVYEFQAYTNKCVEAPLPLYMFE